MRYFWTDGSASPNPGPGGWAVIENHQPVAMGRESDTTNIRMEARALESAFQLADGAQAVIYTDSEFWINVLTKWAPNWEANNWQKKSKGAIQNLDLVKSLYALYKSNPEITLTWIRGHVGNGDNELADEWANQARNGATINQLKPNQEVS